jgi:hypothetical protein
MAARFQSEYTPPLAIFDLPHVRALVKLTDEQIAALSRMNDEFRVVAPRIFSAHPVYVEARRRALTLLAPEQLKALDAALGPPFNPKEPFGVFNSEYNFLR